MFARQGVEGDAHGLSGADLGGVDFVHRCFDVQAGIVDQIDGWRRRHPGGGRRRVFAHLADDLGNGAIEWRVEGCAGEFDAGGLDLGERLGDVSLGGGAGRAPGVGFGQCRLLAGAGDKALLAQGGLPPGFALGIGGLGTDLGNALPGYRNLRSCQCVLGLLIVVPELHQQLPFLDLLAFLDRQDLDTPTDDRRELGALAGFDGSGAGVGNARFHLAAVNVLDDHGNGLGAADPPEGDQCQSGKGQGVQQAFWQARHVGIRESALSANMPWSRNSPEQASARVTECLG